MTELTTGEILTVERVKECREKEGGHDFVSGVVDYALRICRLADSHEALRRERDALLAEVARLEVENEGMRANLEEVSKMACVEMDLAVQVATQRVKIERLEATLAQVRQERDEWKRVATDNYNQPVNRRDYQNVCDAVAYEHLRAEQAEQELTESKAAYLALTLDCARAERERDEARVENERLKPTPCPHCGGPRYRALATFCEMCDPG